MSDPAPRNPNNIGALWTKEAGTEKERYIGKIVIDGKETRITIIANGHKTAQAHPDYIILRQVKGARRGQKKE
jgi:hypothetical protein